MIRISAAAVQALHGFPRIRGGDPLLHVRQGRTISVFPASAGVIPFRRPHHFESMRFPRIRGGDPGLYYLLLVVYLFSPHPRG